MTEEEGAYEDPYGGKYEDGETSEEYEEEEEEDEEEEEEEEDEDEGPTLKKQFVAFVKINNPKDKGTHILNSQSDVWLRQAQVIEGRKLTRTDTGVCFFKFKKYKLNFREYQLFLRILAEYKKIAVEDIVYKLVNCGLPGVTEDKGIMGTGL